MQAENPSTGERVASRAGSRPAVDEVGAGDPPYVTRGTKCQVRAPDAAVVVVDTLRFTIGREYLDVLTVKLADLLGPSDELVHGFHHYANGRRFACGALQLWDADGAGREHAGVCVELKGVTIEQLGQVGAWSLWAWAARHGGRCTRIDVAVDFRGRPGLLDSVKRSCERCQLRGLRRWNPIEPRTAAGERIGYTIELGRRGKDGSGKFLRFYDKGLQTGEAPAGAWERCEAEFCGDAANMVAQDWFERCDDLLLEHDGDERRMLADVSPWLAARVFGVVDFRQPGRLDRSKRVGWWARFLSGVSVVPTIVKRQVARLDGVRAHVKRSLGPMIVAMADASKQTVGQVFSELLGDPAEIRPAPLTRPTVVQYAASIGDLSAVDRYDRACGGAGVDRWASFLEWFKARNVPPSLFEDLRPAKVYRREALVFG